jgi:CHAT domain-containing protein/tetratricopeptide (TPR) repeat protein
VRGIFWLVALAPGLMTASGPLEVGGTSVCELGAMRPGGCSLTLELPRGDFASVLIVPRGVPLAVRLLSPSGAVIAERESFRGESATISLMALAAEGGLHRLEVRLRDPQVSAARAVVSLAAVRPAGSDDPVRVEADETRAAAVRLRNEGGAESGRRALARFEEARQRVRGLGDHEAEAGLLHDIALVQYELGDRPRALELYLEAAALRRVGGLDPDPDLLNHIGVAYGATGQPQKAVEYHHLALERARQSGAAADEASALLSIGLRQGWAGKNRDAIGLLEQSLALWRELGDPEGEAWTLAYLGSNHRRLGESDAARQRLEQALAVHRAARDLEGQADVLDRLGTLHREQGDARRAREYYKEAMRLAQQRGERRAEANALAGLATADFLVGDLSAAQASYHAALVVARELGDRKLEAAILGGLGSVHAELGEWDRALDHRHRGLELHRSLGQRTEEAVALQHLCSFYGRLGDVDQALRQCEESLAILRQTDDRYLLASTVGLQARILLLAGAYQRALPRYAQALRLLRAVKDGRGEAMALCGLGQVHAELGRPRRALGYYREALALPTAEGDPTVQVTALIGMGIAQLALRQPLDAQRSLEAALGQARAARYAVEEASAQFHLARVARDLGRLDEARAQVEAAIEATESARGAAPDPQLRASFLATVRDQYELHVDVLMRLHEQRPGEGLDARAFEASERGRARSLLDLLQEARAEVREGTDPALGERRRVLAAQLHAHTDRRVRSLGRTGDPEEAAAAERELEGLASQLREVDAHLRAQSPRYAALTQPQPLTLPEIQGQVVDEGTVLLEYVLGDRRSYLWAVTPTSITSHVLPPRAALEGAVRSLLEAWRTGAGAADAEAAPARALARTLLGPVSRRCRGKRLAIVADGGLHYLPFAALPDPEGRAASPLVRGHEVAYLPSASILGRLRLDLANRPPAPGRVAVLADPVFDGADPRLGAARRRAPAGGRPASRDLQRSLRDWAGFRLERLPSTRREADAVRSLAPGGLLALDFDASRARALDPELGRYRIVHLATHALVNSRHPELSGIVLSLVDAQGRPQPGYLQLTDVYNLRLGADLVVLSACQTALGKEVKGEGLVGLTHGFMYAGAPRVVASLWRVPDKATAELMRRFYAGVLAQGLAPSAALRAAQAELRRQPRWQAPYFWAGFTLQGEWR